jgi:DNA topoisomerase VI subunit B
MNPDSTPPEWYRNPQVLTEGVVRPTVHPRDIDYGRVISIAPNRQELTFATHDREEFVTVSYETLQHHQRRMTMREWREVEKALVKYGGWGSAVQYQGNVEIAVNSGSDKPSERLTRQQAASLAKALPDPVWSSPEVSETQAIRSQAKEVMNALKAMGASSDDAMAIILSEIAASDDPRAVASQWMTRFTNDVAAIIREGERDG